MKKISWGIAFFLTFTVSGILTAQEKPKNLAPGVMKTIKPFINYSETHQWSDIPELVKAAKNDQDTSFDWAKNLYFSKEVWALEFSFKPIRFTEVDFPNAEGKMDKKTVWYMVYSVKNTGKFVSCGVSQPADNKTEILVRPDGADPNKAVLEPITVEQKANNIDGIYVIKEIDYLDGYYELKEVQQDKNNDDNSKRSYSLATRGEREKIDLTELQDGKEKGTVRFSPQFILVSQNIADEFNYEKNENGFYVNPQFDRLSGVWTDQFLPLAHAQIAALEDPNQHFENSITIPGIEIRPGETVWGIAAWTDIDPRINQFTVYVSGLTNALRWEDNTDVISPDSPPMTGRNILRKVLKLNFYRPGDENIKEDSKVYFGKPGDQDYEWVFL